MLDFFSQPVLFGLLGGLGFFLLGMRTMSEGLQKIAGDRLRRVLSTLTGNRMLGAVVGMGITALVQSSTATTVMVVGFVNAGLMSLVQAIGVVLGANVGTTLTAQIISFNISRYALPAIGLGVAFKLFSRHKPKNYAGEILLGLGLLFFGLQVMKGAFDPIKASDDFKGFFLLIGDNHLLGVLLGALVTILVQSSSATIALTIALASSGLLTYEASVALILGENVGTAVTANLAAIGTNLAARRTAMAHLLFNLIGVAYMLLCLPLFMMAVAAVTAGDPDFVAQARQQADLLGVAVGDKPFIARHIANTHTLFNLINTLVFLPLVTPLAKLTTFFIRGREEQIEYHLRYLDSRVLDTPPIALGQARAETVRMARITLEMLDEAVCYLRDQADRHIVVLEKKEAMVDLLQREISDFLVTLSQRSISPETSREIAALLHTVSDLERVGDHCQNLWQLGQRKKLQRVVFSETAITEVREMCERTRELLAYVVTALDRRDPDVLEQAAALDNGIDQMEETLRNNHIARLNTGECGVLPGLIFLDMLHNLEKIGDHAFNVAAAIAGKK
jgi:phosphate:Na+ symporter